MNSILLFLIFLKYKMCVIILIIVVLVSFFIYMICRSRNKPRKHQPVDVNCNFQLDLLIQQDKPLPVSPLRNTTLLQSLMKRVSSSDDVNNQANDQVVLPHDDGVVSEIVQWWYWTGHLKSADGSLQFGYEVCFFMVAESGNLVQIGITDVTNKIFYFDEYLSSGPPDMTPNQFNLAAANGIALAHGGNGIDHIESTAGPYKLVLNLQQTLPTTLHYGGTRHNYSFGGNTKYYSRTQQATTGTVTDSRTSTVTNISGNTWFDRQYGGLLLAISKGWQWFAIEIYNVGSVMLFDFNGNIENEMNGSFTDLTGNSFEFSNFTVTDVGNGWISPNPPSCKYPNVWQVTFPINKTGGVGTYLIMPEVANQELLVKYSPRYWEGTCNVYNNTTANVTALTTGSSAIGSVTILGKAYVELNGFCPSASSKNNYMSVDAVNRKCYY